MGYESTEEIYKNNILKAYKNPKQRSDFLKMITQNGEVNEMELEVLTKNNREKNVLISAHLDGEIISGIVMDITESKKAMQEVTKLSKAIEQIDDIIMITDRSGTVTFVNDAFIAHTGYTKRDVLGKTAAILKSGKHDNEFYKNMWNEIINGNSFRGLVSNRKKDGNIYYEEKTITPLENDEGLITSFISTGKDITQRIEMQHALEKEVMHDGLTGLFNRKYYDEIIEKELMRCKRDKLRFTFVMMDIDFFKPYNDTYGHQEGDRALKAVAEVLKDKLSRGADFCFRLGGEEFGFFFTGQSLEESLNYTKEICRAIENLQIAHTKNKASKYVTASFGLINVDMNTSIIDEHAIYVSADKALYEAKESGRNRVVVYEADELEMF